MKNSMGEKLNRKEFTEYIESRLNNSDDDCYNTLLLASEQGEKILLNDNQQEKLIKMFKNDVRFKKYLPYFLYPFCVFSIYKSITAINSRGWIDAIEWVFLAVPLLFFCLLRFFNRNKFKESTKEYDEKTQEILSAIKENKYEAYTLDVTRKVYGNDRSNTRIFYIECGETGAEAGHMLYNEVKEKLIFVFIFPEENNKENIIIRHLPGG